MEESSSACSRGSGCAHGPWPLARRRTARFVVFRDDVSASAARLWESSGVSFTAAGSRRSTFFRRLAAAAPFAFGMIGARAGSMDVRIGLCGWTIGMREYFERFPLVEVQQTFYEPPADAVMRRWRDAAPADFEFTLKAWQLITHESTSRTYRRLRTVLSDRESRETGAFRASDVVRRAWDRTAACARILRASSVLFQCPPSFHATPENIDRMRAFFASIERGSLRLLWEPRHASWTDTIVADLCAALSLAHVVDPFVRESVTRDFLYYRLHGIGSHHHVFTDTELAALASKLERDAPNYVLFNNIPRESDAERFERLLAKSGRN